MNHDIGKECCTVTDNLPYDWRIYYSKSVQGRCYLVKPDGIMKIFQSMKDLEDYVDAVIDLDSDPGLD